MTKLIVENLMYEWTWTPEKGDPVTLGSGVHELDDPDPDLVAAIGSAVQAGVLVIQEGSSASHEKAVLGAVETSEEAMAKQDQRVADADAEAWIVHHEDEAARASEMAEATEDSGYAAALQAKAEAHLAKVEELKADEA